MRLVIVIPCYNEEEVIGNTNEILRCVLEKLLNINVVEEASIIYVDDGSSDKTWECIECFCGVNDKCVKTYGIKLANNVGRQNALMAGIENAYNNGYDAIITIDADLQDDVHCIKTMVELAKSGKEIIYGVRRKRVSDTYFKRYSAQMFYSFMRLLGCDIVYNHADFRLMTRNAVKALLAYPERNLFLRCLVKDIGLPFGYVHYDRKERKSGKTKYPLWSMVNFAIEGITSFSIRPLRIISVVGGICIFISVILIIYGLHSFIVGNALPGWTSLIVSLWFIGGIIILTMGVIGEYIGKIYKEVKNRPRYFVEKLI